jgi:hypothetical protein
MDGKTVLADITESVDHEGCERPTEQATGVSAAAGSHMSSFRRDRGAYGEMGT